MERKRFDEGVGVLCTYMVLLAIWIAISRVEASRNKLIYIASIALIYKVDTDNTGIISTILWTR